MGSNGGTTIKSGDITPEWRDFLSAPKGKVRLITYWSDAIAIGSGKPGDGCTAWDYDDLEQAKIAMTKKKISFPDAVIIYNDQGEQIFPVKN